MIHTNINELIEAIKLYRDKHGDKGEIDLDDLEFIIKYLQHKVDKKRRKK